MEFHYKSRRSFFQDSHSDYPRRHSQLTVFVVFYFLIYRHAPEKFLSLNPNEVCISSITFADLEFGACKSNNPLKNNLTLMIFLAGIKILPLDEKAATEYGDIKAALERRGTPIGANDLLIAAHARSLQLVLFTNNLKEFERVDNLKIENWI